MKIGDAVWVYQAPCAPREGIVSEILEWGIRVEIDDRMARNQVYAKHNIFARPSEREKLCGTLRDNADGLERYATELEN